MGHQGEIYIHNIYISLDLKEKKGQESRGSQSFLGDTSYKKQKNKREKDYNLGNRRRTIPVSAGNHAQCVTRPGLGRWQRGRRMRGGKVGVQLEGQRWVLNATFFSR